MVIRGHAVSLIAGIHKEKNANLARLEDDILHLEGKVWGEDA